MPCAPLPGRHALRQQLDRIDQEQVINWSSIGNDEPHAFSKSEPFQIAAFTLQIIQGVGLEYAMCFQKAVKFVMRVEAQQSSQVRVGQMTEFEFFERERFERAV